MNVFKLDKNNPDDKIIKKAAKIIRDGGLVVFPTETVYGLGANALNKKAVKKIFKAKDRPLDNPLIVHISDVSDIEKLAKNIPVFAYELARKFWPGPLTIVLEARGGKNTIALRIPDNKIALLLIKSAGVPIAAPSANISSRPSPTNIRDAVFDLKGKADIFLDSGRTKIGLESTVIDLTVKNPKILRPGAISKEDIQKALKITIKAGKSGSSKSPGTKHRHYSPEAKFILAKGKDFKNKISKLIDYYKTKGFRVGIMASKETKNIYKKADGVISLGSSKNLEIIARNIFSAMRKLDKAGIDVIISESFPKKGIGLAIMDRLERASSGKENKR